MIHEDDGVLSFEWVMVLTVLVIGIVSGVAAARDAIVDELGDAAQGMVALDQSYIIDFPPVAYVVDAALGFGPRADGGSDSGFTDAYFAEDCTRGYNAPQGQEAEEDQDS
jgi:hypothetical protein